MTTKLEQAFADFLHSRVPSAEPLHRELAILVSQQYTQGHACVDLNTLNSALRRAAQSLPWAEGPNAPLVLDGTRLYLRRNWQAEQNINKALQARLATACAEPSNMAQSLDLLFPPRPGQHSLGQHPPDLQRQACLTATRSRFTLITGGPGTGKTTTVVRLLALLQTDRALRIALAAPTGKAAARLSESIRTAWQFLPASMQQHPPLPAVTLHRLLQQSKAFAYDLVVVDEASMVDLDMMARLLATVPLSASLILLGDKDQLASVEAGAVLAQLCEQPDLFSPLARQTVTLHHSHRFDDASGIGLWAKAVNQGDVNRVMQLWQPLTPTLSPEGRGRNTQSVSRINDASAFKQLVRANLQPCMDIIHNMPPGSDAHALEALVALSQFQVLCALRAGPWGVDALNRQIAQALHLPAEGWYAGRPIMVTRNDYELDLMNGDIGLCLPHNDGLRIAFPAHADQQGQIRWLRPSRLDAIDTVFAMTVHKSQGSEFKHVCLVLPDQPTPVLTRELLYTGITRAKQNLSLWLPLDSVLPQAVAKKVQRAGGLNI